ncbi:hypothetical protein [Streptomyces sp. WMMB303]|uniref:hypothetical protein n=1 Tax=Streptomyces sp. WMMB303 TaxID=3034154 RepID=UPI0023EBB1A3|nr:hypothetical protein [Streptomyces sp. WMMB303]MDF4254663.1 hypothetical protein [Streptomyces sp. WMMB303]MDF4254700.1 hypothetical protein [Streptomyces sp. WMMB303]
MSEFASIIALEQLLDGLAVGPSRARHLSMVRGEMQRALVRDALPVAARRSLRRLLEDETLTPYLRLAESGVLRARAVEGGRPPTSVATNVARRQCLELLREALGLPRVKLGGESVPLRTTPDSSALATLRRQLDRDLAGWMPPGQVRLTAVLALVLDAALSSGQLSGLRLSDLAPGRRAISDGAGGEVALSPLGQAALGRWLPLRADLVRRARGTSRLWVSLWHNHDGHPAREGATLHRPPGVPLESNGLVSSYRRGRRQYGLERLLPPKMEALRRAVESEAPPTGLVIASSAGGTPGAAGPSTDGAGPARAGSAEG